MMLTWTLKPRKTGTRPTNYCEMVEIVDSDEWPVAIVMTDVFDAYEWHVRLRQGETLKVRLEVVDS